jgi:hypothetical protein
MINGLVRRHRHTRLTGKTHHGAIPGFELRRLPVDNVSLQRGRHVFGEAIEKRHSIGNNSSAKAIRRASATASTSCMQRLANAASQGSCG